MSKEPTFYAVIRRDGNSLVITIPSNYARYANYTEGETVKATITKDTTQKLKQ